MNTTAASLDFLIRDIADDFDATARILEQLGSLFMTISKADTVRKEDLANLGCYTADHWAAIAEHMGKRAREIADRAKEKAAVGAAASM